MPPAAAVGTRACDAEHVCAGMQWEEACKVGPVASALVVWCRRSRVGLTCQREIAVMQETHGREASSMRPLFEP